MPRKPPQTARLARELQMAFPLLRDLSETFDLHFFTIFRLLRDLSPEGFVGRSSSGKFYPVSARRQGVCGLPVYFIGRDNLP